MAGSVEDVLDRLWNKNVFSVGPAAEDCRDDEMEAVKEVSLEDQIKEIVDIIPVTTSHIMEELNSRGVDLSIPKLIGILMDMTAHGDILQNGAYYRRVV